MIRVGGEMVQPAVSDSPLRMSNLKKKSAAVSTLVAVPRDALPGEFLSCPFLDLDSPYTASELCINIIMLPFLPLRMLGVLFGVVVWALFARLAVLGLKDSNGDSDHGSVDTNTQVTHNYTRYCISRIW